MRRSCCPKISKTNEALCQLDVNDVTVGSRHQSSQMYWSQQVLGTVKEMRSQVVYNTVTTHRTAVTYWRFITTHHGCCLLGPRLSFHKREHANLICIVEILFRFFLCPWRLHLRPAIGCGEFACRWGHWWCQQIKIFSSLFDTHQCDDVRTRQWSVTKNTIGWTSALQSISAHHV